MTNVEIKILEELYKDLNQINATNLQLLGLGIKKSAFYSAIQSLIDLGYIEDTTDEGQKLKELTAYQITKSGIKAFAESKKERKLEKIVRKYGLIVSIVVGAIGTTGVGFQIYFGIREDNLHYEQFRLELQQQQTKVLQSIQDEHPHLRE